MAMTSFFAAVFAPRRPLAVEDTVPTVAAGDELGKGDPDASKPPPPAFGLGETYTWHSSPQSPSAFMMNAPPGRTTGQASVAICGSTPTLRFVHVNASACRSARWLFPCL